MDKPKIVTKQNIRDAVWIAWYHNKFSVDKMLQIDGNDHPHILDAADRVWDELPEVEIEMLEES
jgi:hypothetical protein